MGSGRSPRREEPATGPFLSKMTVSSLNGSASSEWLAAAQAHASKIATAVLMVMSGASGVGEVDRWRRKANGRSEMR